MKKRLFALVMAGVMTLGCTAYVMAESDDTEVAETQEEAAEDMPSVYWSDYEHLIEENEDLKNGGFYEENEILGLKFYLPASMEEYELTEEEEADGMLKLFSDGENESMAISLIEDDSIKDIFDYEAVVRENYDGDVEIGVGKINDLPAVLFGITDADSTEDTYTCIAFVAPEGGKICLFTIAPADSTGAYQEMIQAMVASIQAIEE